MSLLLARRPVHSLGSCIEAFSIGGEPRCGPRGRSGPASDRGHRRPELGKVKHARGVVATSHDSFFLRAKPRL